MPSLQVNILVLHSFLILTPFFTRIWPPAGKMPAPDTGAINSIRFIDVPRAGLQVPRLSPDACVVSAAATAPCGAHTFDYMDLAGPRVWAAGRLTPAPDLSSSETCSPQICIERRVAVDIARGGAIASAQYIAVRRATILILQFTAEFSCRRLAGVSVTQPNRTPRTSITIRIDVPRAGCSLNQFPSSIFRRPLSDVSTALNQIFSAARLHHHHEALRSKFDFCASAERRFRLSFRKFSSRCAGHFIIINANTPFPKFEISRSRERGFELGGYQCQIFLFPLRGANFNTTTSSKFSSSQESNFLLLRCAAGLTRSADCKFQASGRLQIDELSTDFNFSFTYKFRDFAPVVSI
ncbi:hypothetical protein R3P38DRAFT_2760963 [Favolaschia claudopus]|uniref:Uncharacterized protein n=1 Tax=Favolaschia claudopus TaxID=2862362 RepID=A0AAW0DXI2_9AGAR